MKMYVYEIIKFCDFRVSVSLFCSYMLLKFCASLDDKVSLKLLCMVTILLENLEK